MNLKLRITAFMLGMMTLMPSICYSMNPTDSLVMNRIWSYRRNFAVPNYGQQKNLYMRYSFSIDRRNPLLFLVPTMYVLAQGAREYLGESYCKVSFREADDYDMNRQVVWGTIPRQRTAMPAMRAFSTPDFYDDTLYPDYILSPFFRSNRRYYKYKVTAMGEDVAELDFKPIVRNTQLVKGHATVDRNTGRLLKVELRGDFDMIKFYVKADMGENDTGHTLPKECTTTAHFRFLGNKVSARFMAVYDCPTTLPDSVSECVDRDLMASLRPHPLSQYDEQIYAQWDSIHTPPPSAATDSTATDSTATDSTTTGKRTFGEWLRHVGWNIIGDNLINGNSQEIGGMQIGFSPLFNPLYLGYSQSRGISYRLRLGLRYNWNAHRYLTLEPQLGYNFKQRQFFYTAPLRMTYNPKRNGYAEITWANGNHISNATLINDFQRKMGMDKEMPEYKDMWFRAVNNVVAYDWLEIMTGVVYHRRVSLDRQLMRDAEMPDIFYSFAPMAKIGLTPWHKGPTMTVNYEHGLKGILNSNLNYQRWELDAEYRKDLPGMRIINTRVGTGFYTQRKSSYFVDFENFHENYLPSGWEDDWSGQFQLLDSRWYNESNYYIRCNMSYDTPILALAYLPLVGRFIEKERIYLSALSIEHTRPYFELGYGFSNSLFSMGLFTNVLGGKVQHIECKFTVELFHRW